MVKQIETARYFVGETRELLALLPESYVNCVVTSPPYYQQRSYPIPDVVWGGTPGCVHVWGVAGRKHKRGPRPATTAMVSRSVVKAQAATNDVHTGTFCFDCGAWIGQLGLEPTPELYIEHMVEVFRGVLRALRPDGTCWVNVGDSYAVSGNGAHRSRPGDFNGHRAATEGKLGRRHVTPGLKHKDLVGIPWMLAFALRADGWHLRTEIVWHKINGMPEAVKDRPVRVHEYVFLLTKSARYHYDAAAVMEPCSPSAHPRGHGVNPKALSGGDHARNVDSRYQAPGQSEQTGLRRRGLRMKSNPSFSAALSGSVDKRHKRSVWPLVSEPSSDEHYAAFPKKLVEPCVLAGCPPGGIVLDPFGGSGTVGRVAEDLGRRWILFDLGASYAEIAKRKTAQTGLLTRLEPTG